MNRTQPVNWLEQRHEGYMVNTVFSDENATVLDTINTQLSDELDDAVYTTTRDSLHITLLDWIAPLVDYDETDKNLLYKRICDEYDTALEKACYNVGQIAVHFTEIRVSPSTIFIVGHDDGQFQAIRERFLDNVKLLPGTKLPPTIIHSSLARFTKEINMDAVEKAVSNHHIDFMQHIDWFRLVHSYREPLLEFDELKRYKL
ncbi:MAG: hypothetical protein WAW60_02235 [Candidatus Saccharimonadales bacterium]